MSASVSEYNTNIDRSNITLGSDSTAEFHLPVFAFISSEGVTR